VPYVWWCGAKYLTVPIFTTYCCSTSELLLKLKSKIGSVWESDGKIEKNLLNKKLNCTIISQCAG
jgi:hypothetical protein